RHHARRRPGRPEGEDLPHRPHRLVRRVRHHDGARRDRARARGSRRRHRTRRRSDGGARSLRALVRRVKVLIRESIADAGVDLLRARFDVDVDLDSPLEDIVGLYDAIVVRSATKLTAEVIESATNLKVIGRAGVGVDNVDVEAATRRGIVVANDPYVASERFRELGAERVETPEEIYAAAEFITLHLPLTDETRQSIDADAFARMRDGVRIVNAARGQLVDESALLDALRSGKVAGAALDVFSAEPYSGPL